MGNQSDKKLNIAMLGQKRVPSREGGVEVVVEELSTRMVALGHSVTCYNRSGHHVSGKEFDGKARKTYKGIRLKTVPTVNRRGFAAMTSSLFGAIACTFSRYDVVHFHAEGPCAMLWLPKLFGKRCVATIHGIDWQRAKWGGIASRYIKFGEWVAAHCADEIIVLSQNVKNYFLETYGRETVFIPNGISRPAIREPEEIERLFGLRKDEYILFLGRLVPEKGLANLVTAFRQVKTRKKLVIAGGNSDSGLFMRELQHLAEGDGRILFTGFVQGRPLEELYSNAYFYTLPSDLEGMPLSLLEAMSYGNACLVSDIPECAEVVGDKAVTFRRGDMEDLRDKLQQLCDAPQTVRQLREGACEYILRKYNWDDVVRRTLTLYG